MKDVKQPIAKSMCLISVYVCICVYICVVLGLDDMAKLFFRYVISYLDNNNIHQNIACFLVI